jgi:hypothetical protein
MAIIKFRVSQAKTINYYKNLKMNVMKCANISFNNVL